MTKHGHKAHGQRTSTYVIWQNMRRRCLDPEQSYLRRGIKVCKRWEKFENFLADMGERPPGLSLDRKKNHCGYNKRNCRWATQHTQTRNCSRNVMVEIDGVNQCLTDWARHYGVAYSTARRRINRGLTITGD